MKAAVFKEARKLVVEDVPEPKPGADEVVVKVKNVGICGSDLHLYLYGLLPPDYIMGHETTGVISEVGDSVTDWSVGDKVWIAGGADCGHCEYCLNEQPELCNNHLSIGTGLLPGAYAEYVKAPTRFLTRLPDDIDMKEATLIDPMGCGHHAVDISEIKAGQSVLVVGGGPIGLCTVHYLKSLGIEPVILSEPNAQRAELGRELGADAILNPTNDNIDQKSKEFTNGIGPDIVYECVGNPATTLESVSLARNYGTVVWVGVCMEEVSFVPALWMLKRPTIMMIIGMGRTKSMDDYFRFMREHKNEIRKVITETISLDRLPDAFDRLLKPGSEVKIIVEF